VLPQFVAMGAPSIALPAVGRSLGLPFGATAWVLAGWALTSALAMPLTGRLVPRWGTRRVLVLMTVTMAGGSLVAAFAPSLLILVAGRLIGGFGAGGTMIAAYSALTGLLVSKERDRALGTVAAFGGMASACGTLVGGVLTAWLGWRAAMAVPAVGLPLLVFTARLAPVGQRDTPRQKLDWGGAVALAVLGGAFVTLLQARSTGLSQPVILALVVAAVLSAAILVRRIRRRPDGFVPRRVVGAPGFLTSAVAGLAIFGGYYALLFAAPSLIEGNTGWGSLGVGAVLLPPALCSLVAARLIRPLTSRLRTWQITAVLGVLSMTGMLLGGALGKPVFVVVALALGVCGFTGAQAVLFGLVPRLVADEDSDTAQGLFSFLVYGGSSIGTAVVGGLASALSLSAALAGVAILPAAGVAVSVLGRPGEKTVRQAEARSPTA
jgi:MFS family permease